MTCICWRRHQSSISWKNHPNSDPWIL